MDERTEVFFVGDFNLLLSHSPENQVDNLTHSEEIAKLQRQIMQLSILS